MRRRTGIIRQRVASASVALLAASVCLLPSAAVRGAEPEVTMRVLDDASDASAVLAEAVAKRSAEGDQRRPARERRVTRTDNANRTDDGPDRSERDVELDTVLDREQQGESEIEDRDVPEDIDFTSDDED